MRGFICGFIYLVYKLASCLAVLWMIDTRLIQSFNEMATWMGFWFWSCMIVCYVLKRIFGVE